MLDAFEGISNSLPKVIARIESVGNLGTPKLRSEMTKIHALWPNIWRVKRPSQGVAPLALRLGALGPDLPAKVP